MKARNLYTTNILQGPNSMVGCVRNCADKSPAMELSSQLKQITAFVENNNIFFHCNMRRLLCNAIFFLPGKLSEVKSRRRGKAIPPWRENPERKIRLFFLKKYVIL
jgi:hypothetical protein